MANENKARPRRYAPFGAAMDASKARPGLYLVATPIGNLGDVTLRALELLAGADVIACEDTRVTRKLIDRYGLRHRSRPITNTTRPKRGRSCWRVSPMVQAIALVSDAGTPLISDPGYKLVRAACEAGHGVTAFPGASSVLAALSVAGLPTDRFFFEGFLPAKQAARQKRVAELANIPATLVLFESGCAACGNARRPCRTFGTRAAAICRELTKLHEEVGAETLQRLRANTPSAARRAANSSSSWRRPPMTKGYRTMSTICCARR